MAGQIASDETSAVLRAGGSPIAIGITSNLSPTVYSQDAARSESDASSKTPEEQKIRL